MSIKIFEEIQIADTHDGQETVRENIVSYDELETYRNRQSSDVMLVSFICEHGVDCKKCHKVSFCGEKYSSY